MQTKDVILELRTKQGLSQEELAEQIFVTRQAVSRWENGETVPNVDTLKLLSRLFGVSINTLLGSPEGLVCACCGMPLEDGIMSRETDGSLNEEYCQWCYANGKYTLDFWKQFGGAPDKRHFDAFKAELMRDFNACLSLEGLPPVEDLNVLPGEFVNMEYTLPNGITVKLLDDNATYLGSQLEGSAGRCYGIAGNTEFLLICSYGEDGADPELVLYKKR